VTRPDGCPKECDGWFLPVYVGSGQSARDAFDPRLQIVEIRLRILVLPDILLLFVETARRLRDARGAVGVVVVDDQRRSRCFGK
jgi:hypothetical protein